MKVFGSKKSLVFVLGMLLTCQVCFAGDTKEPNVAGQFYPKDKDALAREVDSMLEEACPEEVNGRIFAIISPHAGYDFSGTTAAFGYKLIKGRPYKTVIVIAPSHHYAFYGISVYPSGRFKTPLGEIEIDSDFCKSIIDEKSNVSFKEEAFAEEHSLEVQLPFLQRVLNNFKIVPVIIGDSDFKTLKNFSDKLSGVIAKRSDVLLVASTDMCHSYDYNQTLATDEVTVGYLDKMSAEDLYKKLKDGTAQMCGGLPVVAAMLTAKELGHNKIKVLKRTNSAQVTGRKIKGLWTVGYVSAVVYGEETSVKIDSEVNMLNDKQKKRLLEIARKTIEEYITGGERLEFDESDPKLKEACGAFVTLHEKGPLRPGSEASQLRGCIGNIVAQKPLYITIRDMAIESATADPRFPPVEKNELENIEIEISVLSPLKKINDINEFQLGVHGVIIKKGRNSGVFLPQVAVETGWSKEEFLSNLCEHKAGLPANSWKDASCEMYIFSATVFSEKELK